MLRLDPKNMTRAATPNLGMDPKALAVAVLGLGAVVGILGMWMPLVGPLPALETLPRQVVYVSPALLEGLTVTSAVSAPTPAPEVASAPVLPVEPEPTPVAAPVRPAAAPVAVAAVPKAAAPRPSSPSTTTTEPAPIKAVQLPYSASTPEPARVELVPSRGEPVVVQREEEPPKPVARVEAPAEKAPEPAGENRPPREIRRVQPMYPSIARSQRIGGRVVVRVTVGADGAVQGVQVVSSPSPLLNQAASDAAKKMTFEPALSNGQPARGSIDIPFNFVFQ